jgi:hypothetical protein
MHGSIHGHDDDFLFEQQRDRHDSWFQTVVNNASVRQSVLLQMIGKEAETTHEVEAATHRQDSFRDLIRDAVPLFRRLIQLLVKRKPTSLERRYEKEIVRLEECGMAANAVRAELKAHRDKP